MESFGPVVLRWTVGALFVAHGLQTLAGAFGGGPLAMPSSEASAGALLVGGVGAVELGGGVLLVLGAFTRAAAVALGLRMAGALWTAQFAHGFVIDAATQQARGHGVEYSLVVLAALVCLLLTGPGALSIDGRRLRSAEAYAAGRARLRSRL